MREASSGVEEGVIAGVVVVVALGFSSVEATGEALSREGSSKEVGVTAEVEVGATTGIEVDSALFFLLALALRAVRAVEDLKRAEGGEVGREEGVGAAPAVPAGASSSPTVGAGRAT